MVIDSNTIPNNQFIIIIWIMEGTPTTNYIKLFYWARFNFEHYHLAKSE